MNEDRGFGIIEIMVVVVVLALIGGGVYLWYTQSKATSEGNPTPTVTPTPTPSSEPTLTPTPDPTAGWQTYTNASAGYTLKYPAGWAVRELSADQANITGDGTTFSIKRGALDLGVYEPTAAREYDVQVDGRTIRAKEFDLAASDSASEYLIAFEVDHHDAKFSFRLGADRGANREHAKQTQLLMLSTFRFTD